MLGWVDKADERLDWIMLMKEGFVISDDTTSVTYISVEDISVFDSCVDGWRLGAGFGMMIQKMGN